MGFMLTPKAAASPERYRNHAGRAHKNSLGSRQHPCACSPSLSEEIPPLRNPLEAQRGSWLQPAHNTRIASREIALGKRGAVEIKLWLGDPATPWNSSRELAQPSLDEQ